MSFLLVRRKPAGSQKKQLIISIGTKVSRKAVVRNLIKRRIRAVLRPFLKNPSSDFFIIVRPPAAKASFQELKEEITNHL